MQGQTAAELAKVVGHVQIHWIQVTLHRGKVTLVVSCLKVLLLLWRWIIVPAWTQLASTLCHE